MKSVCVFPDSEKLAEEIARSWLEQARQTINNYGTFSVVLSGGSQDPERATYFPPRIPKHGKIDWSESADNIYNLVRALTYPYPGAYFYYRRKKMLIVIAKPEKQGPLGLKIGVPTLKFKIKKIFKDFIP